MPSLPPKMKVLSILTKTLEKWKLSFSRGALFCMKTRVRHKYFDHGCIFFTNSSEMYNISLQQRNLELL